MASVGNTVVTIRKDRNSWPPRLMIIPDHCLALYQLLAFTPQRNHLSITQLSRAHGGSGIQSRRNPDCRQVLTEDTLNNRGTEASTNKSRLTKQAFSTESKFIEHCLIGRSRAVKMRVIEEELFSSVKTILRTLFRRRHRLWGYCRPLDGLNSPLKGGKIETGARYL